MHATVHAEIHWTPTSEAERSAVLRQMDRILNSRHFRNSKRYPVLLEYLIRVTLAGNSDSLKERLLGVAVFHRPADYDANADPVVRVTAAEIRKRIAQFYQEEGQADEIYIGLRPGSYVPEFHPIKSGASEVNAPTALDAEAKAGPLDLQAIAPKRWRFSSWGVVASVLIVLVVVVFVWRSRIHDDQRSQMWSPLLDSPAPVLFVVGQPHAAQLEIHPAASVYAADGKGELYLPDAIAVAHLTNVLDAHHHLYQIAGVTSTSLSDLRKGPIILVGGFNNPWTLRVLSPLRFTMRSVTEGKSFDSPQILEIADRKSQPGSPWILNLQEPIDKMTHDYAIIARFQASMTDGVVMVVAGLGAGGTESASKFINSSTYMKELTAYAPREWSKMNMEAVLETEVIGGRTGHTHIVATEFW
ncbi:MAG TPA: hypothetical protein VFB43_19030 [Terracidiphilus sp.]|nr:hypothetical protein [Terracidiphilus sp.]